MNEVYIGKYIPFVWSVPYTIQKMISFFSWLDTSNQEKKKSPHKNVDCLLVETKWFDILRLFPHSLFIYNMAAVYILPLKVHTQSFFSTSVWKSNIKSTTGFWSSVQCFPIPCVKDGLVWYWKWSLSVLLHKTPRAFIFTHLHILHNQWYWYAMLQPISRMTTVNKYY